ncbi:unannotated protein [freshwater metagenome]|uniref:Unannotated protein n=1 Tax=freshwater metagenome TaxID=449393 RepID=A0A6J6MPP8_9ZZZZ
MFFGAFTSARFIASVMKPVLEVNSDGKRPPNTWGQKYINCFKAAEWKVRAATFEIPRVLSRARISPAARAVKVNAKILFGSTIPISTA